MAFPSPLLQFGGLSGKVMVNFKSLLLRLVGRNAPESCLRSDHNCRLTSRQISAVALTARHI
ncbi:MAG TPA: hypothetical protein P5307_26905, partial [Pirellulaceae bacterium]|nr:hypothetical protein [Pirellulaceae bacterium]